MVPRITFYRLRKLVSQFLHLRSEFIQMPEPIHDSARMHKIKHILQVSADQISCASERISVKRSADINLRAGLLVESKPAVDPVTAILAAILAGIKHGRGFAYIHRAFKLKHRAFRCLTERLPFLAIE